MLQRHLPLYTILVKVGQVITEKIGVMPISLPLLADSIELHFASDHFLWLLLWMEKLCPTLHVRPLQQVEIATLQIIEKVGIDFMT